MAKCRWWQSHCYHWAEGVGMKDLRSKRPALCLNPTDTFKGSVHYRDGECCKCGHKVRKIRLYV